MDKSSDRNKLPDNFFIRRRPRRLTTALFHLPVAPKLTEKEQGSPSNCIGNNNVNVSKKQSDDDCQNPNAKIERAPVDDWDSGSNDDTVKQQGRKSDSNCKINEKGSDSCDHGSSDKAAGTDSPKRPEEMKGAQRRPFGNMPQGGQHQQQRHYSPPGSNKQQGQHSNTSPKQHHEQVTVPLKKQDSPSNSQKQNYGRQQQGPSKHFNQRDQHHKHLGGQQFNNKSSDQKDNQDQKIGQRQQLNGNPGQVNHQGQNYGQQRQWINKPGQINQGQKFGNQRRWRNESPNNNKNEGNRHQQHWGNNTLNQKPHPQGSGSKCDQRQQGPIDEGHLPSSPSCQQLSEEPPPMMCEPYDSYESKEYPPQMIMKNGNNAMSAQPRNSTNQHGFGSKINNQRPASSGTGKTITSDENQTRCSVEHRNMPNNQRHFAKHQRGSWNHAGMDTQQRGAVGFDRKGLQPSKCGDHGDRLKKNNQGSNGGNGDMKQGSNGMSGNRFDSQKNQGHPNQRRDSFNNNGGMAKRPANYFNTPLEAIIKWLDADKRRRPSEKVVSPQATVEPQNIKDENGSCTNPSETYELAKTTENQGGYSPPLEPTATVTPENKVISEVVLEMIITISRDAAEEVAVVVEPSTSVAETDFDVHESEAITVEANTTSIDAKTEETKPEAREIPSETVVTSQKPTIAPLEVPVTLPVTFTPPQSVTPPETHINSPETVLPLPGVVVTLPESSLPSSPSSTVAQETDVTSQTANIASTGINVTLPESIILPPSNAVTPAEADVNSPKTVLASHGIAVIPPESSKSPPSTVVQETAVTSQRANISSPGIAVPPSESIIFPTSSVISFPETDVASPKALLASSESSVTSPEPATPTPLTPPVAVGTLPTVVVTLPQGIVKLVETNDAMVKTIGTSTAAVIPSLDALKSPQEDSSTFQWVGESTPGAVESETSVHKLKAARIDLETVVAQLELARIEKVAGNKPKEFPEVGGQKNGSISSMELVDTSYKTTSAPQETAVSLPDATLKKVVEIEGTSEEQPKHVECVSATSSQVPEQETLDGTSYINFGNTSGYGFLDLEAIHQKIYEGESSP
ncbi:unnamed protein product [Orchesella dallaii]|uniref:Uncharacterized protein n=1 Tax=Orchesella dallaii TaxID=48710 RepID=A0ABP1PWJ9_9HEXA